jgi:alcohol dehydrogenase
MRTAETAVEEKGIMVAAAKMKALVYHGPGQKGWEEKPKPKIEKPGDAIVRITTSTICGTDLHILKGDVPSVVPGRILGHEGVGIIEEVGAAGAWLCGGRPTWRRR